ncbi:MAG: YgjV family protein [Lachnospiraceae bacterium]
MGNNVVVQIIGLIGTALFFISFQCKSNKNLFRVQFLSYLFYTTHLILLGAITGGISYIINGIRSFCLGSKIDFLRSRKMCVIICVLQLMTLIITWSGWLSLLPVVANIASTIGGYTHNARKIRIAGMFVNSPLWIIYDIIVGSWAGILDELVSEGSMIISIVRYGWKELDKVNS